MARRLTSSASLALALFAASACRSKSGELSAAQLSAVVAREQASLAPCYQSALDKTPYTHEFRLQAILRVLPNGNVADVNLDQPGIEGVGPCVQTAIRRWKFPTAKAETHASLPIVFTPKVINTLPGNMKLPPGFKVLQDPH